MGKRTHSAPLPPRPPVPTARPIPAQGASIIPPAPRRRRGRLIGRLVVLIALGALAYGVYWAWDKPFAQPYIEKAYALAEWAMDKAGSLIGQIFG